MFEYEVQESDGSSIDSLVDVSDDMALHIDGELGEDKILARRSGKRAP